MPFVRGQSGNPNGAPRGKPHKRTSDIRALVRDNAVPILKKVIEQAKLGDVHAQATFIRLLPRYRFVSESVDLPLAQSAAESQEQIARLTSMAARGDLDLDSLQVLSRSLTLAIDTRLEVLEERLGEREREVGYET